MCRVRAKIMVYTGIILFSLRSEKNDSVFMDQ